MLTREEIIILLDKYPESVFWVDEAYVQYIPQDEHEPLPLNNLVPKYDNLYVSRTFSFAYGLAGVRIGYLLGPKSSIQAFEGAVTNYRLGTLQEQLAIAALTDENHIDELLELTAKDREQIGAVLEEFGVEVVPSKTHFILGRFTDNRTGEWLASELKKVGIRIKHFVDVQDEKYRVLPYYTWCQAKKTITCANNYDRSLRIVHSARKAHMFSTLFYIGCSPLNWTFH